MTGNSSRSSSSKKNNSMANSKLYVGNLSFETTETELQDLFAQVGPVQEVLLMQDRMTGKSRGFAFVTMVNAEDAGASVQQFHGKPFGGRPLTVNEARPREERSGGGGGGGYSGGRRRWRSQQRRLRRRWRGWRRLRRWWRRSQQRWRRRTRRRPAWWRRGRRTLLALLTTRLSFPQPSDLATQRPAHAGRALFVVGDGSGRRLYFPPSLITQ